MLLSVIIPVYNTSQYLKRCLESIINQTYSNLEIIIINDGSTDSSEQIIKSYELLDSRIKYIYQKNCGLSSTRNRGIEIATGQYITFVDSDDWIEPDMYTNLMNNILYNDCEMIICGVNYVNKKGELLENKVKVHYDRCVSSLEAMKIMLKSNEFRCYAVNKIYDIKLFKNHNISFPVGQLYEDVGTLYKLIYHSNRIYLCKDCYYNYYQDNDASIQNLLITDKKFDLLNETNNVKKFLLEKNILRDNIKEFQVFFIKHYFGIINMLIRDWKKLDIEEREYFLKKLKLNYEFNINTHKYYFNQHLNQYKMRIFLYKINFNLYKLTYILFKEIKRNL